MDALIEGYRRFRAQKWPAERARYEALAARVQQPKTLVVSCSDSRVDPQTIFDAAPGELFVVRNVAGLVPPYTPDGGCHGTSAALEYGVRVLKVERIVVLGHAQCGGVRAMVDGAPPEARDFVAPWMAVAASVLATPPPPDADPFAHYEAETVRLSLRHLQGFPWVSAALSEGQLSLEGFRFGIATGALERLVGGRFVPVT
jgi:carbonic anhydrase